MRRMMPALAVGLWGAVSCCTAQAQPAPQIDDSQVEVITVDGRHIPVRVSVCPVFTSQALSGPGQQPVEGDGLDDYLKYLSRYLNDRLAHPRGGHQGMVCVHFMATRDGHVLLSQLETSSGYDELDSEAVALLQRAAPLPAVPAGLKGDILNAVVPVFFAKTEDLNGPAMMGFGGSRR